MSKVRQKDRTRLQTRAEAEVGSTEVCAKAGAAEAIAEAEASGTEVYALAEELNLVEWQWPGNLNVVSWRLKTKSPELRQLGWQNPVLRLCNGCVRPAEINLGLT